jgi:hypothetical protein
LRDVVADIDRALGAGKGVVDGAGAVFADQVFGNAARFACLETIHGSTRAEEAALSAEMAITSGLIAARTTAAGRPSQVTVQIRIVDIFQSIETERRRV